MEKRKKNRRMPIIKITPGDEKGSVLLVTVIILLLLTLIGVSGTNTASTDLQITRNYRVHKQNLVLAEAACNYAMTMVEKALDANIAGRSWVASMDWNGVYLVEDLHDADDKYFKDGSDYNPKSNDPVTNQLNVREVVADWDTIPDTGGTTISPEPLSSEPDTEYLAFIQIEEGAELAKRVTSAVVIARCQRSGGDVVIERGVVYGD